MPDAGNARDYVIQAFQVLNVERGPDIDAGVQQLLDVLPALGVAGLWFAINQVGMRQFIDQQDRGRALERGVEIEFAARDAAIANFQEWELLESLQETLGFASPVRFHIADHHIDAGRSRAARGFEHGIGLADAGGSAEEDLKPSPSLERLALLEFGQQLVGIAAIAPSAISGAHQAPD